MRFLRAIFEQDGEDPVPLQQKEGVKPSHVFDGIPDDKTQVPHT